MKLIRSIGLKPALVWIFISMAFAEESEANLMDNLWSDVLGDGNLLPEIITQNFDPISRLAFVTSGNTIASNDPLIGDYGYYTWQTRNKLLPVIVAAYNTMFGVNFEIKPIMTEE